MEELKSQYRVDEIKYNIDTAIQRIIYEKKKKKWDAIGAILQVQSRLYEEFGIEI